MVKEARGMLYGITMEADIYSIYRAVLEGLTFEMCINLDALSEFAITPERVYASGGGARSSEWLQIKADIFGREIIPVAEEECGALGSVMLAATALGCCKDEAEAVELFVKHKPTVYPNKQFASKYSDMYNEYKRLREIALTLCDTP